MARSPKVQLVIDGKDNTKGAFSAVEKNMAALEKRTAHVGRAMAGAFAGFVSIGTLKQIGQINSEWVDMSSRLRRVTADEEEFASVTERLGEVAESTWSGLNETIESYLSMQGPLADMGYTTQEQVDFVSALNNALVVSGAKKEVAASVQNALNKAMASGVLRGENLNTVIEKGGRVADLLAQKMGVTVSELRALGAQGKITSEVVYDALAGNMQLLAKEAEAMPATFDDALGRVRESFIGAFRDEELMQPLTDSLLELAGVLKDPAVREGLAALAKALAETATAGVAGLSELGDGFGSLTYRAKQLNGTTSQLEDLEYQLKQVDRALNGSGMTATLGSLLPEEHLRKKKFQLEEWVKMAKDGQEEAVKLDREIAALQVQLSIPLVLRLPFTGTDDVIQQKIAAKEAERDILIERRKEQQKLEQSHQEMLKGEREKELAALRKHVADMKTERDQLVVGVKKAAKDIEKAEKDSLKKIEDLRKERLGIEERYRKAIAKLTGASGPTEATYSNAQLLKMKAREALAKGDLKEAQEYAQGALEILEKIKEAGGNTYGFAGFAKELEGIELGAKDQEIQREDEKRKKALYELTKLKELADEVESIDIRVDLDEESLANVKTKLDQLAKGVDITPSVGGAGAAGASSVLTAAGAVGGTVEVKVDADTQPAKTKIYQLGNSFSDQPFDVPVDAETGMFREGIYRAGNSFSDRPLDIPVDADAERLKQGIYRVGNSFSDQPIQVEAEVSVPSNANEEIQSDIKPISPEVIPVVDESSVAGVTSKTEQVAAHLAKVLTVPVTLQMQGGGTDQLPGFATGGHIRGPGTGTSDSILARLSNGEFVMRAAAVRKYGLDMLHRMNNMQIPQFATGGLVEQVSAIEPKQPQSVGTLNFNLPGGESFSVQAAADNWGDLRRAALKYGKPR